MMHICHVSLAKGFSGGERQALNLIRALSLQDGIRQSVVIRADAPLNQYLVDLDVTIIHSNHHLTGHMKRHLPKGTLLHAHDGRSVYWCVLQNLLHGSPYVITRRVDNPLKSSRFTRLSYSRAQKVVCVSRAIVTQVFELSPSIPVCVIPDSCSDFPTDPDVAKSIRDRYQGKVIVGQVGKLIHHKGFHLTIDVAARLATSCPNIQFILLGAGEKETELKEQARGLENVEFLGHQSQIGNYLAAMDLMLFPSLNEGLGSSMLEAWQHHTPVIASDAGGIPDIIEEGVTGLLVPAGDADALERALLRLVEDRSLQESLATTARARLADYSPEAIAERYLNLYQQVLN